MKLKASQVLIIVFGFSFVVSACFSLDALFMYTYFVSFCRLQIPLQEELKLRKNVRVLIYVHSMQYLVNLLFVPIKKMLFLQAECAHSYFRQWLLIFAYSICLVGSLKYI